jgi:hypothetical protein
MWQFRCSCANFAILSICAFAGCPAAPSAREEFEAAKKAYEHEQAQLDALLPGYTAAKQTAMTKVVRELAGATSEEQMTTALGQLDSMSKALAENQEGATLRPDDFDALEKMAAKQGEALQQIGALTGSAGKAAEVTKNIQMPGTPEAKRYEEALAAMPEAQAYERQQKRLEQAKKAMDEAESKLPAKS